MGSGSTRAAALVVAACVSTLPAQATYVCQNLEGTHLIVGEARFELFQNANTSRALNAYFDGDLELDMSRGATAGGVGDVGADNLWIYAYVFARDAATDNWLNNVSFVFTLNGSNSGSAGCPTGSQQVYTATLVFDQSSEDPPIDYSSLFWGGHEIGFGGINAKHYWRNNLAGAAWNSTWSSDDGCFFVDDSCTLEEYF